MDVLVRYMFFFFQAEDGIRDYKVTGVQTCALPIYVLACLAALRPEQRAAIEQVVTACADMFQRASSCVEGRNGQLSLRHHSLHNIDRKSTRLNSSHLVISYAVFCLKKKKTNTPVDSASSMPNRNVHALRQVHYPYYQPVRLTLHATSQSSDQPQPSQVAI